MPGDLAVALLSIAGALGMGVGGVLFAVLALLGLHVVLTAVPALYIAFKIAGGAYLVYLGWVMWRGARRPLGFAEAPLRPGRSFWLGLLTQLSNPKTALVYASVFVAWALSARSPRAAYLRSKTWIDRAAGSVMAALGIKLIALR